MLEHDYGWDAVPSLVQDLYVKYAYDAGEILAQPQNHKAGWVLPTSEIGPVLLKQAEGEILPRIGNAWRSAQSMMGGPNPMTSMLLSGAVAGGLGYGGGYLLHKLMPNMFKRQAATAGGILGLLGGTGSAAMLHGYPGLKHYGIKGLFTQQPLQGGPAYPDAPSTAPSRFDEPLTKLKRALGYTDAKTGFDKHAMVSGAGGTLPKIPTDDWGRVVMRDPFLEDNEKALAAGLPAAAGAMRGSRYVSPNDVARVAVNAGLGYGYGYLGSIAGKFLGLSDPMQKGIQQAGLLAGAIRGITGML